MNAEMDKATQTPEDVLNELRSLVTEAERLLGKAPREGCGCEETVDAWRHRLQEAQERLTTLYGETRRKVTSAARTADNTIRDNPYQSLAVAVGVGLLAGVLLGRRWTTPER